MKTIKNKSKLDNWVKSFRTGCINKKAYKTVEYAKKQANIISKKKGIILHCYVCPNCFCYHLTSKDIKKWKNKIF